MHFFVIFRQILGIFFIVGDIWVLREHTYPARKMKKINVSKARQGHIEQVRTISGSLSQKWCGHLDVCAVECKSRVFGS